MTYEEYLYKYFSLKVYFLSLGFIIAFIWSTKMNIIIVFLQKN